MNEQDILDLIKKDEWMMKVLKIAEDLDFPDWVIGAGFIRNKVWDHLHGFSNLKVDTNDIDLVYYNLKGNDQKTDEELSQRLRKQTGIDWEIVNEAYAHKWNNLPPYKSTEDALSQWPETVTGIGVRLENGELTLLAPHGINDLVDLIVRPSPNFPGGLEKVKERAKKKGWFEKWPKLKFITD
ncbi:MAG: nucleotidyltransferase family protein [Candidatus Pacebacteria bacterium]|nr:nucleotidyltransferase family protein [Candidatus Paceibacterota bacterium]